MWWYYSAFSIQWTHTDVLFHSLLTSLNKTLWDLSTLLDESPVHLSGNHFHHKAISQSCKSTLIDTWVVLNVSLICSATMNIVCVPLGHMYHLWEGARVWGCRCKGGASLSSRRLCPFLLSPPSLKTLISRASVWYPIFKLQPIWWV
jgi:hypothetical protein